MVFYKAHYGKRHWPEGGTRNPFRVKGGRFPACHQESGCEIPDQASRHWKKTAERMLLELKDLTGPEGPLPESNGGFLAPEGPASALTETMEALASLGYTQNEISGVMNRIKVTADMSAEDLLKKALQVMARRG